MNGFKIVLTLLPPEMGQALKAYSGRSVEEIRLRLGKEPGFICAGREIVFCNTKVSENDLAKIIERACGASLHAVVPELSMGYINYRGLRIGICGTVLTGSGKLTGFRNFSSLAIRIPGEHRGICEELIKQLYSTKFENTLLVSPPGGGKTTALREIIRSLSDKGTRIAVVDERNELAACDTGQAGFDLGSHSDVLSFISKAQGSMMLLRGMNPEIIAMDEITDTRDIEAMEQISGCGVGILATAHGSSVKELWHRPVYRRLLEAEIFKNAVVISSWNGKRHYESERLA